MTIPRTAALLVLLVAVAGCASMGDSKTQALERDPASLEAARTLEAQAAKAAWPTGDWWKSFGDALRTRTHEHPDAMLIHVAHIRHVDD